ncbi:hypothetical protein BDV34DRAFT_192420 [Aspergillus parasiticus]|uniref:Uncharacterized protein n=1 Tax=Aspergillus parasiticus TaxID=5067 RepID=A0A5N6DPX0_ASPPA|nr:hypothetical protein BDV34DRAFT_192420 [Aspergillus parasiticus]
MLNVQRSGTGVLERKSAPVVRSHHRNLPWVAYNSFSKQINPHSQQCYARPKCTNHPPAPEITFNLLPTISSRGKMASESKKTGKYKEAEREPTNVPSTPASAVPGPSEKDSKKIVINDKTQYKDYFLRKNLGWKVSYERKSFPISCRSEEAKAFEKTVTRLEEDLSKHKIRWTSIDCIGRSNYGTADPIKSTILISVPPGHSPKYKSCWNCEWNNKKISLAIEILNGGIEQESFGNTSNKMDPLACGSSCGSLSHQKRTGTIGGFINLANGLDNHQDKPIYAMSCHHVFAPDQPRVKWGDEKIRRLYDMVYKKLDGQYHPSHEPQDMITMLINWIKVAFDFQETECLLYFKILVLTVDNFQPRPAMISFVAHSFLK